MIKLIKNIIDFFLCFLRKNCEYSIKKMLAVLTFDLIVYLAVFTDKDYYELLIFLAVLLGIRSYDKRTYFNQKQVDDYIEAIGEEPSQPVTGFKQQK